ncbi:MAG: glyceraldehyde 3-phosphate dehydrogenase NAD-binding domain-containing protein, partial [Cyanobacteria bacterium J06635_1]
MIVRVAINGFGRIGRLVLRAAWGWPELQFVHVNEIKGGTAAAAHLLKFDSVHGRWQPEVEAAGDEKFLIDGQPLSFSDRATPGEVLWDDLGVDIVLECSGKFRTPALLEPYFKHGVNKVIVAAPVKQGAL